MSWARFGSKCQNTIVPHAQNEICSWDTCPGSSVYVYEGDNKGDNKDDMVCCLCALSDEDGDFRGTRKQMVDHLHEHATAGHHVRPSLLLPIDEDTA